jgi:hypothetical protein
MCMRSTGGLPRIPRISQLPSVPVVQIVNEVKLWHGRDGSDVLMIVVDRF